MLVTICKLLFLLCCFFTGNSEQKVKLQRYPHSKLYSSESNKSMEAWVNDLMPGVSSINTNVVAAQFLNGVAKLVQGGLRGLGTAFVHIHPKHLALLLQFGGEIASKSRYITEQTFLDSFTRFYVPFGESSSEGINYNSMKTLIKQVSEYNLKQKPAGFFSSSKQLSLWISIPATANITLVLYNVLDILKNTNSVSKKTVTALLLNYRSLVLTAESVPLIRDDLALTKDMIEYMVGGNVLLRTGIVLEMHNCPKMFETSPLQSLELTTEDEILFMPQLYSVVKDVNAASATISCFLNGKFVKSKISLQVPVKIKISLENSTFTFMSARKDSLDTYASYSILFNKANLFLKAEITELLRNKQAENVTQDTKIDKTWLEQDTTFDPTHFGVSVHPPENTDMFPSVISKVFEHFKKVIVESQGRGEVTRLKHFAASMAHHKASMVRAAVVSKGETNFETVSAQLLIIANIFHGDKVDSWKSVKGAFEAAVAANEEYPGIASVMLNMDAYTKDKSSTLMERVVIGGDKEGFNFFTRVSSVTLALLEFKKTLAVHSNKSDYMPKVGFISEYCAEMFAAGSTRILVDLNVADYPTNLIVLKIKVEKSVLLKYGALRAASDVIEAVKNCDLMMIFNRKEKSLSVYVQLTGCNYQDNLSIYEQTQVVKFWELLNSWAVKEKKTIFMGGAFELPKTVSNQKHGKVDIATTSSTTCGWWKVRNNGSNVSNASEWNWQDRKSIAVMLYEELNSIRETQSFGTKTADAGEGREKLIMAVFIPTSLLIVVILAVSTFLVLRYRSKYILSTMQVRNLLRGRPVQPAENGEVIHAAESQPYNEAKYEIPHSSFQIDFTRCLGSGEFATVMCGAIKRENVWVKVAVKMIKKREHVEASHGRHLALKGFISEIKILSFVGEHKNIIKMEAACTATMRSGKLFVFLEMCEFGSLHKYLRAYNPPMEEGHHGIEMRSLFLSPEISTDLRRWSIEIASGMEFLSSKKVIHGDLATRNILLDSSKCAKISDFGLSRRLYDYSEYLKKEAGPLPWRWMASESLRKMIFNEKSDVWAFGITLWEMYSLDDEPYPGLAWDVNFPSFLERGLRLDKPKHNQEDIYSLMKLCWEAAPANRPTFAELKGFLQDNAYVTVL